MNELRSFYLAPSQHYVINVRVFAKKIDAGIPLSFYAVICTVIESFVIIVTSDMVCAKL
jgi:hypothetical protein